jgi:alginate O-acetyltransferase complex protein AlgI
MLFNSLEFAIFLPLVAALFFAARQVRQQVAILLVASSIFYMAFIPAYILILLATILVDYWAALWIVKTTGRTRRFFLIASIVVTCAILFVFKYYNFFVGSFAGFAQYLGWQTPNLAWNIILPIGLSFHTFQSLSYVIEVYRGNHPAERNFATYATYVLFFPQLVAGPIERPQGLLDQFAVPHRFDYDRVTSGLKRMAWGFFKKLVVADRLALYVNDVYAAPQDHNGLQLTIATVFFAYQIYCDFSGYSDIAIGTARIFGFRLMENFDTPYHSRSIGEFWRRWHISLSTWFRDYLYIPLGGNRHGHFRQAGNLVATFAISGLWHGANWTYILWGILNGVYLVVGRFTKPVRAKFCSMLGLREDNPFLAAFQIILTFFLTCAAWVLFRANSLSDALYIYTHFFRGWNFGEIITTHMYLRQFAAALLAILLLEAAQLIHRRWSISEALARLPTVPRWASYIGIATAIVMLGVFRNSEFIYFQF